MKSENLVQEPLLDSRRIRRGAFWTLAGFGAGQVIRFASNLVLIRWVFQKEDFGMAALVFGFLQGLMNFGDLGVAACIVQNKNGHNAWFRSTAWTLQLIRSLLLSLLAFLVAPHIAEFYGQPDLEHLIRVSVASLFFGNLIPTTYHLAGRTLGLGRTVTADLTTQIITACLSIGWGLLDPRPHVLVAAGVFASAVRFALIWRLLGNDDRPRWHPVAVQAILRFAKWACVGSLLTFASSQADRLIFGSMIEIGLLGVYAAAANIIGIPTEILGRLTVGVVFPVLCQRHAQGVLEVGLFRRSRLPLQVAAGIMLSCLLGAGPIAIGFLFPADFADAGWIVQILAAGCWVGSVLDGPRMWALIATGHNRWSSLAAGAKLAGLVALLPLGHWIAGFPGALAAYAAADLVKYAASLWGSARIGLLDWKSDLGISLWFLASSAIAWLIGELGLRWSGSYLLTGAIVLMAVCCVWAPLGWKLLKSRSAAISQ